MQASRDGGGRREEGGGGEVQTAVGIIREGG